MKRLVLFVFALGLSLGVVGIGAVRADAGHQHPPPASPTSQSIESHDGGTAILTAAHLELNDHRHGHANDCDGICAACCAAACGSAALNGAAATAAWGIIGPPVRSAMLSHGDSRNTSPPSPPPRS